MHVRDKHTADTFDDFAEKISAPSMSVGEGRTVYSKRAALMTKVPRRHYILENLQNYFLSLSAI